MLRRVVFALILAVAPLAAQTRAQIDAQIGALFADIGARSPGAAVLVLRDGRTVFERGYGITDQRTFTPIAANTNFRLASCTKQFTAMAIMLLVHDGKLSYDQPLTGVLPDFPAYGKSITIRHLLTHTSGLVDYEDLMEKQYAATPPGQIPQILDAGVLQLLEQQSATRFPPGTGWEYSNSGFAVLAMVVERASGKRFGDFLRERIFRPLGMRHTVAFEKNRAEVPNRAYGHSRDTGPQSAAPPAGSAPAVLPEAWHETDQSSTSAVLGDGGIYSSLDDLKRWIAALDHYRLLSAQAMQPAYTPAPLPPAGDGKRPPSYGFGWFLDPYRGHRRLSHDGSTLGFRTTIQRLPDDRLTVIVLSNRGDFDPARRAEKILDLFLGPEAH